MRPRLRLHPGHGAGHFVLGSSPLALRSAAGDPETVEPGTHADDGLESWTYHGDAIEVRFDPEDGERVGWIVVRDPRATLAGLKLIGREEQTALDTLQRAGIGPIVLADDFGGGMRDYEWAAGSLSIWVSDGVVESITLMPFFDETGNVPLWPDDVRPDGAAR